MEGWSITKVEFILFHGKVNSASCLNENSCEKIEVSKSKSK